MFCLDAAHVIPLMFIATTPAKYCYRAIATFFKHVTNMPPTASLQKHRPLTELTSSEMVASPVSASPPPIEAEPTIQSSSTQTRPTTRFSRMTSSFRRGSSFFLRTIKEDTDDLLAGDPIVYHGNWVRTIARPPTHVNPKTTQTKAESSTTTTTMIRERVSTQGVIRPLEPESEIPLLQVDTTRLGRVSAPWAQIYLEGVQKHEKKFATCTRQIARRRERAIALLPETAQAENAGVDGEGWSVAWALKDPSERPPPSSLVARCDTPEARALVRAATKQRKVLKQASDKGEFWRRLSIGRGQRHQVVVSS